MNKIIVAALFLFYPSLAMSTSCQVYVCAKQNGKIIPPALQAVKEEACFVATTDKKNAVEGKAYKPSFRSVQTAHKAKRLYIKRVIGCVNIGGKND